MSHCKVCAWTSFSFRPHLWPPHSSVHMVFTVQVVDSHFGISNLHFHPYLKNGIWHDHSEGLQTAQEVTFLRQGFSFSLSSPFIFPHTGSGLRAVLSSPGSVRWLCVSVVLCMSGLTLSSRQWTEGWSPLLWVLLPRSPGLMGRGTQLDLIFFTFLTGLAVASQCPVLPVALCEFCVVNTVLWVLRDETISTDLSKSIGFGLGHNWVQVAPWCHLELALGPASIPGSFALRWAAESSGIPLPLCLAILAGKNVSSHIPPANFPGRVSLAWHGAWTLSWANHWGHGAGMLLRSTFWGWELSHSSKGWAWGRVPPPLTTLQGNRGFSVLPEETKIILVHCKQGGDSDTTGLGQGFKLAAGLWSSAPALLSWLWFRVWFTPSVSLSLLSATHFLG